jgi:hypothetical protein
MVVLKEARQVANLNRLAENTSALSAAYAPMFLHMELIASCFDIYSTSTDTFTSFIVCIITSNFTYSPYTMRPSNLTRSTRAALQTPLYDFLAPSLINTTRSRKNFSTTPRTLSATTHNESSKPPLSQPHRTPKAGPEAATNTAPPSKPLTQAQRDFLTSAVSTLPLEL